MVIEKPLGWRPAAPQDCVRARLYADGRKMTSKLMGRHDRRARLAHAHEMRGGEWFASTFKFSSIVRRIRQSCRTELMLHIARIDTHEINL